MPAAAAPALPADPAAATVARIAAFMDRFSLEATRPSASEIAALKGVVPPGTAVYLSAVPAAPTTAVIEPARLLRAAGFEPVPHLAARGFASRSLLDELISELAARAGVRRVLAVAGDRDRPAGPFAGALELIETGLLQRYGIAEVGVAGYPEGHPRLSPLALERALAAKIEAAEATGLAVHIVTQFCFDASAVLDWIARLRERGVEHPVRIGMAGPTSLPTLLRYAKRCGVRASLQGLARQAGLVKHLLGVSAPDGLIRPLAAAAGRLGHAAPHLFSFGGVAATGRWAAAARAGAIALDRAGGFRVEPR